MVLVAAALLVAQVYVPPGGPVPARTASSAPPGSSGPSVIVGQIVDASTGRGVSHAIVHIDGPNTQLVRVADDKGRFFAVGLRGGSYSIAASKSGYFDGTFGQRRAAGDGRALPLADHQWITDVRIGLWRPAVVGGVVTDEAGEPLVGVRVEALRRDFDDGLAQFIPMASVMTNDQGAYRMAHLLPGEYVVVVPSSASRLPAGVAFAEGLAGAVPEGAQRAAATTMILDSIVQTGHATFDASMTHMTLAGFGNPPPASGAARPMTYPTTYFPGTPVSTSALSITLATGETRNNVDVSLTPVPRGAISGHVVAAAGPTAGQVLRLLVAGEDDPGLGREVAITIAEQDGAFRFPDVPLGDYVIDAPSHASLDVGGAVNRSEPATPVLTGPLVARVQIKDDGSGSVGSYGRTRVALIDQDVTDVRVELEPAASIAGQVVFESATLAPPEHPGQMIMIDAVPRHGSRDLARHAFVDDAGALAIRGLARDEYFLRAGPPPAGWYLKSIMSGAQNLLSTPFDLRSSGDLDDLVITFTDKPTMIGGAVYDKGRAPVATATVIVFPADASFRGTSGLDPDRIRATRADPSGAYQVVGLPAGDYLVAAIDEATADGWRDPARLDALRPMAKHVTLHDAEQHALDLVQIVVKR
jgi:Carboxypeptidase regulatory-like domain